MLQQAHSGTQVCDTLPTLPMPHPGWSPAFLPSSVPPGAGSPLLRGVFQMRPLRLAQGACLQDPLYRTHRVSLLCAGETCAVSATGSHRLLHRQEILEVEVSDDNRTSVSSSASHLLSGREGTVPSSEVFRSISDVEMPDSKRLFAGEKLGLEQGLCPFRGHT